MNSKIRTRIGKGYPIRFNVNLGQRNAVFASGTNAPLRHIWGPAEGLCIIFQRYDLIHAFNTIPLFSSSPFIITFESHLPRVFSKAGPGRYLFNYLRNRLLNDRCAKVLAMSEYALREFRRQNRSYGYLDRLEKKIELFYPAVRLYRETPKKAGNLLRVLTVGNDFMRKGIPAVVRAHEILRHRRIPIETTIVSALSWARDDYIGPPSERLALDEKQRLHQDGIRFLGCLPNEHVIKLMGASDYFLFPTYHDTFGFVSIEAMACGTPVLASNTCAQPEIIDDDVSGFLLPIENDLEIGRWIWIDQPMDQHYIDAYLQQLDIFARAMADRLESLWEQRQDYERLSAGAIQQVQTRFNHEIARQRLEKIYAAAVAQSG